MNMIFLLLGLLLPQMEPKEKLKVVTTLEVYRELVEKIGGDLVEVEALVHPRRDPHYIPANPLMQRKAAEADLFIETGRSLELWTSNLQRAWTEKNRLIASRGCSVKELPKMISREWGDIHPAGNPHVWLDPFNMKRIGRNVAEALVKLDPANKMVYFGNLKRFDRAIDVAMFGKKLVEEEGGSLLWRKFRLGKLDTYLEEEEIEEALGGWLRKAHLLRGQKVVSYHKSWVYLADRFGFDIVDELEAKPGIEPSAKDRDEVVEVMKKEGIKVILNGVMYPTRAADYVAEKTGAKVVVIPIDVGGIDGTDTYLKLIDTILQKMVDVVK
jgi:zinc/manganese transport system substrate-binding protein